MHSENKNRTMQVDIHNMVKEEAGLYLKDLLDHEGREIDSLVVIHGYRGGQVLQQFVREEFTHPSIHKRLKGLNKGMTTLLLTHTKKK